MKIKLSDDLIAFSKLIGKKADLFLVGGFVRNYFLGVSNSGVDLASKLTLEKLFKLTENSNFKIEIKNERLGTALIKTANETWEYSTFRKEVYGDDGGHSPIKVAFISDLLQDAKRRDFTANSIYYNISKDEIIDVYSGLLDIKKRILRSIETPDYVFENDGLRILRMVRLACELNFKIDRDTHLKAKQMTYRLKDISGTRKIDELHKILQSDNKYPFSKSKSVARGLKHFNNMGIWASIFPGASKIKYKMVFKVSAENRFLGLLIDLINTVNPDCVSYYLEFALGKDGLMLSKSDQKEIIQIISGYFDALNGLGNKKYFFNYYPQFPRIAKLLDKRSIYRYKKYNFYYKYINKYKIPIQIKDIKIGGQDLQENFPEIPKKRYTLILNELFNLVFDGKVKNEKEELLKEVEKIK